MIGGSKEDQGAIDTALSMAKKYGAHVRFLHMSPHPSEYIGFYGDGLFIAGDIITAIEKEIQLRLENARKQVKQACTSQHIPIGSPEPLIYPVSAAFLHRVGLIDMIIAEEGRTSDLIVISQYDKLGYDSIAPVFTTGKPVLRIPASKNKSAGWKNTVVALAWDGSLEAARALHNAFPLIADAQDVHILMAREDKKPWDSPAEIRIRDYLRAHGFDTRITVIERDKRPVGTLLLTAAMEANADLLVMGAYGHSMFREMILGGVTETMLKTADLPVLMSH
jgi:nucleotide-binding universal stress UspA family protein